MMSHLIDRRENSRGKSAVNRARFLRRYKAQIGAAVKKMVSERRLADMEQGGDVYVPRKDISEPAFGFGPGGDREIVLPGNRTFVPGDRIPRPEGGSGSGGPAEGGLRPLPGIAAVTAARACAAVHRGARPSLSQSRHPAGAGRPRRDVLPDGRLGVDG